MQKRDSKNRKLNQKDFFILFASSIYNFDFRLKIYRR